MFGYRLSGGRVVGEDATRVASSSAPRHRWLMERISGGLRVTRALGNKVVGTPTRMPSGIISTPTMTHVAGRIIGTLTGLGRRDCEASQPKREYPNGCSSFDEIAMHIVSLSFTGQRFDVSRYEQKNRYQG